LSLRDFKQILRATGNTRIPIGIVSKNPNKVGCPLLKSRYNIRTMSQGAILTICDHFVMCPQWRTGSTIERREEIPFNLVFCDSITTIRLRMHPK